MLYIFIIVHRNLMRRKSSGFVDMVMVYFRADIDDLMQDCSISSALAMEMLQSCTKPSIRITGRSRVPWYH